MIRVVIENLLLFLLPAMCYVGCFFIDRANTEIYTATSALTPALSSGVPGS